jgi:hypothetical protein
MTCCCIIEDLAGDWRRLGERTEGLCRDFAAWLGLVPRQVGTGERTMLGKISKRGSLLRDAQKFLSGCAWRGLSSTRPVLGPIVLGGITVPPSRLLG